MRSFATVALFLIAIIGSSVLSGNSTPVQANETVPSPTAVQDEIVKKLEVLTKRVDQLENEKMALQLKNKTQAQLLGEIYRWMKAVSSACEGLDASVQTARENGFEKAGPNPRAKKEVLSGLENFAGAVRSSNPTTPRKKPAK